MLTDDADVVYNLLMVIVDSKYGKALIIVIQFMRSLNLLTPVCFISLTNFGKQFY